MGLVGGTMVFGPMLLIGFLPSLIAFALGYRLAGGAAADGARRQFAALSRLSGLFADRVRALPAILSGLRTGFTLSVTGTS